MVVVLLQFQLSHCHLDLLELGHGVGVHDNTVCDTQDLFPRDSTPLLALQSGYPILEVGDAFVGVLVEVAVPHCHMQAVGVWFIVGRLTTKQTDTVLAENGGFRTRTTAAAPITGGLGMAWDMFGENHDIAEGVGQRQSSQALIDILLVCVNRVNRAKHRNNVRNGRKQYSQHDHGAADLGGVE